MVACLVIDLHHSTPGALRCSTASCKGAHAPRRAPTCCYASLLTFYYLLHKGTTYRFLQLDSASAPSTPDSLFRSKSLGSRPRGVSASAHNCAALHATRLHSSCPSCAPALRPTGRIPPHPHPEPPAHPSPPACLCLGPDHADPCARLPLLVFLQFYGAQLSSVPEQFPMINAPPPSSRCAASVVLPAELHNCGSASVQHRGLAGGRRATHGTRVYQPRSRPCCLTRAGTWVPRAASPWTRFSLQAADKCSSHHAGLTPCPCTAAGTWAPRAASPWTHCCLLC